MKYEIEESDVVEVLNLISAAIHPTMPFSYITGVIMKLRQLKEMQDASTEDTTSSSD